MSFDGDASREAARHPPPESDSPRLLFTKLLEYLSAQHPLSGAQVEVGSVSITVQEGRNIAGTWQG